MIGQNPERHLARFTLVAGNLQNTVHHSCTETWGRGVQRGGSLALAVESQRSSW